MHSTALCQGSFRPKQQGHSKSLENLFAACFQSPSPQHLAELGVGKNKLFAIKHVNM